MVVYSHLVVICVSIRVKCNLAILRTYMFHCAKTLINSNWRVKASEITYLDGHRSGFRPDVPEFKYGMKSYIYFWFSNKTIIYGGQVT